MKKIKTLIAISFFVLISLTGCSQTKKQPKPDPSSEVQDFSKDTNPIVTIEMEDGGIIKLELYPDIAPNTVNNFIKLVEDSFYDGLLFHRVIPGFMIQGGDPKGTGTGGAWIYD